jgi:ATP-dependent DNA ligase
VWRTPVSVVVERSEDFVARVEELGLDGVVAKRLSSTYIPGRRCMAWVKHDQPTAVRTIASVLRLEHTLRAQWRRSSTPTAAVAVG